MWELAFIGKDEQISKCPLQAFIGKRKVLE